MRLWQGWKSVVAFGLGLLVGQVLWNWAHPPAETREALMAAHHRGLHPGWAAARAGCPACQMEKRG